MKKYIVHYRNTRQYSPLNLGPFSWVITLWKHYRVMMNQLEYTGIRVLGETLAEQEEIYSAERKDDGEFEERECGANLLYVWWWWPPAKLYTHH